MGENQCTVCDAADQHCGVEQGQVALRVGVPPIEINQICLCRVRGGGQALLRVGLFENRLGHGDFIGIPADAGIDVPQVAQCLGQLLPARLPGIGELVPVVDVLLLVGDEQQRCQFVEQQADRIDLHRQMRRGGHAGLQGQVMLTIEVRHRGTGQAEPHQGVGQRSSLIPVGYHSTIHNGPGGLHDHRQTRVYVEIRIQRLEGFAQRF